MAVYYSVRVSTRLLCNCKAYKFPHDVSKRLCSVILPTDGELSDIKVVLTPTSLKRAKDLVSKGYF